ncbi:MAG: ATP-binding protein [Deltaproteobacteria bacterium]|nr:MAG: ATP-binding protein [Deltaproteobacteria bacterium]
MTAQPNAAATAAVIAERCKELKLPTVVQEYVALCRQAEDGGWGYETFLADLLEREVIKRRQNVACRRLREARFPDIKTLDQLDFRVLQGVSKTKIQALSSGQFITDAEDVVIIGPIGTGKTHLAIALGVEAANRRTRVAFVRAADLVRQLVEARDDRQLGRLHRRYQRVELLVVDELGFIPLNKTESELIFNLFADRYERRSTIVTSNLAFGEWVQIFGSEKLTTALLDRLAHHAHVLATKGSSYRTNSKRRNPKR